MRALYVSSLALASLAADWSSFRTSSSSCSDMSFSTAGNVPSAALASVASTCSVILVQPVMASRSFLTFGSASLRVASSELLSFGSSNARFLSSVGIYNHGTVKAWRAAWLRQEHTCMVLMSV